MHSLLECMEANEPAKDAEKYSDKCLCGGGRTKPSNSPEQSSRRQRSQGRMRFPEQK